MSSSGSKIECRWCKRWVTLARYRKRHGRTNPHCLGHRTHDWVAEHDYAAAGRDTRVLELAGVVRYLPLYNYIWREHPEWLAYDAAVAASDGSVEDAPPTPRVRRWSHREDLADYTAFAPRWAVELARRLMDDQVLVKALGVGRSQARVSEYRTHRANRRYNPYAAADSRSVKSPTKLVLPLEYRAMVIRTCAANALVREMIDDDPLAALTIMRDVG